MVSYYGDFAEDDTVNIPFNTFDSNDPSASVTITNLADADIHVHKDGSVTQIVTDGATVVINFDGITGNHMITIDTSVDAAYATGSEYAARIEGTTVDGATINAWVGAFSIERAGGALALAIAVTSNLVIVASDTVAIEVDTSTTLEARLSDVESSLVIVTSDLVVLDDAVSDVESSLVIVTSDLVVLDDAVSDVESSLVIVTSDLVIVTSDTVLISSDVAAIEDDTSTAGVVLATDAVDSTSLATTAVNEIVDQNWNEARSDHVTAGSFGHAFAGLVGGLAQTGTLSTTQMTTNLGEATDDHYIGRTVVWISGALAGQASDITDSAGASGLLTFTAVTEAPANNDEFILF